MHCQGFSRNKSTIISLFQGHAFGLPLTAKGKAQANLAGQSLKNERFDQIYSSDLERALETATLVNQNNNHSSDQDMKYNDIRQNKLLRERDFGIYNLKLTQDFSQGAKAAGYENDEDFVPEGGESGEDVSKRVEEFIDYLLNSINTLEKENIANDDYRILIVTHGGWIMRFIRYVNQFQIIDPDSHCEEIKDYGSLKTAHGVPNTSIFTFDLLVDNCKAISYNCTKCNSFEHLNGLETFLNIYTENY